MKIIQVNNKIYQLSFGLKSLIALEELLNINVNDKIIKFYLALNDFSLTLKDAENIMSQLECDVDDLLNEVMLDSVGNFFDEVSNSSIKEQCEELYQLAVGKIGISPTDVFLMTPKEIMLAYKGYLQNKDLDLKINILSQDKKNFSLLGEGCLISTAAQRKDTFEKLKI